MSAEKLRATQKEVERLHRELDALEGKERGVLGEIEKLDAELRVRDATLREAGERISVLTASIAARESEMAEISNLQTERRRYLSFRLREMYKRGPGASLRRLFEGSAARPFLTGLRYATYLSEKDRETLASYRADEQRVREQREALVADREGLASSQSEESTARAALARSRAERRSYLASIQRDRRKSQEALGELEEASRGLGGVVGKISAPAPALPPPTPAPPSAAARLRGSLDWPAPGKVVAGFGNVIHPQFKTVVPHPGLDIEAPAGADIHAVLEGKVAYSAWLRGYGLTAIVDHGGGLLSVYAHAAVLLVEQGEEIERGQVIGKVGDTGSLRGAYLYFEMREDGKPVDPARWLKRR